MVNGPQNRESPNFWSYLEISESFAVSHDVSLCFFPSLSLKSFKSHSRILKQGSRRLEATIRHSFSFLAMMSIPVNARQSQIKTRGIQFRVKTQSRTSRDWDHKTLLCLINHAEFSERKFTYKNKQEHSTDIQSVRYHPFPTPACGKQRYFRRHYSNII